MYSKELWGLSLSQQVYYIEASIDLNRTKSVFNWDRINTNPLLVYCSLGSQNYLYGGSRQFFQTVIDALAARPDLQLLISVGKHVPTSSFSRIPPNVVIANWVPQLEALQKSKIMITHGGLGTVKECIYFGVPMIVFPYYMDQPRNAVRIVSHGLGVRGKLESVTVEQLLVLISKIEEDQQYQRRIKQMGEVFRQAEEAGRGVKIIEKILSYKETKRSFGEA